MSSISTPSRKSAAGPGLPTRLRVLFIATNRRTGEWLARAFASDTACDVELEEVVGSVAGLARLRDELFDAVLVSHEPGELDALELIEGYRTGVADAPIIVLGTQSEQEMAANCYELGADAYACVNTTTTRSLIWMIARAVERHDLLRENGRLRQVQQRRLQQEHDEAGRLLEQQKTLIDDLEQIQHRGGKPLDPEEVAQMSGLSVSRSTDVAILPDLPEELVCHYRELLRTYVIMGSGNLSCELGRLAELLVESAVSASETMRLHIFVLEELVQGLGTRSTRHVMTRADLLALEIMIHLAERYRARYRERTEPSRQQVLPGFEEYLSETA